MATPEVARAQFQPNSYSKKPKSPTQFNNLKGGCRPLGPQPASPRENNFIGGLLTPPLAPRGEAGRGLGGGTPPVSLCSRVEAGESRGGDSPRKLLYGGGVFEIRHVI